MQHRLVTLIAVVLAVLFVTSTLTLASERISGTVQGMDVQKGTCTLKMEDGKTRTFQVDEAFLADLEKGSKVVLVVENEIVVAVDKDEEN